MSIVEYVYNRPILLKSYLDGWDGFHEDEIEDFNMTVWAFVNDVLTSYEEPSAKEKSILSEIKELFPSIYDCAAESAYMKAHDL